MLITFGLILIFGTLADDTNIYTGTKDNVYTVATFDGYEGGFYYFTDEKTQKAISLTEDDKLPINRNELKEGDVIGQSFEIVYKVNRYNKAFNSMTSEDEAYSSVD